MLGLGARAVGRMGGRDPTNDQFVDDRYVVLIHGRDYDDVPVLKGVILSDASHSTMRVHVDVTRVCASRQRSSESDWWAGPLGHAKRFVGGNRRRPMCSGR